MYEAIDISYLKIVMHKKEVSKSKWNNASVLTIFKDALWTTQNIDNSLKSVIVIL